MPTVLSNDAVMTFSSSKQISAHVWVFRTYIQCPVVKSQSLTDLSSDPTKKMTSGWPQNDCKNWTGLRSVHAQWQIAATCHSNGFVCSEEFCENLFLHDRILSQQHVVENQIRQNFYDLLQWQIFTKVLQYTWSNVSLQGVAATSRLTCTHGVICCHDLLPSVFWPLYLVGEDFILRANKQRKTKSPFPDFFTLKLLVHYFKVSSTLTE